jgi:transcriptional regulator GlxA family with amidase domain
LPHSDHTAKNRESSTIRFGVLAFPGFPMMAFSAVIEPLRAANKITGTKLYEWFLVGQDPKPIVASNGITINPDYGAKDAPFAEYLVVCSGGDADRLTAETPLNWLRRNLRRGANIGSVADGAFYLARAGLLDGYACILHWISQPAFTEAFPNLHLVREIFVIDRKRFTSAGGIGAFDMMLEIITQHHAQDLAKAVAEWFVHDRIRDTSDRERLQLRIRTGIRDDLVLKAVGFIEAAPELQVYVSKIADELGVSIERLERAFKEEVGIGPSGYIKRLRLHRDLIEHSSMAVREIGLASGYLSFSSFVRACHQYFGQTPASMRNARQRR